MSLPANFSSMPGEEPHRIFRNICIDFKKCIKSSKNIDDLQEQMLRFINASKQMNWQHHQSGVYHKESGDKACDKVWAEFKRYIMGLATKNSEISAQDLINALADVEKMIESFKVR